MVKKFHAEYPLSDETIRMLIKKKWKKAEWVEYLVEQLLQKMFS